MIEPRHPVGWVPGLAPALGSIRRCPLACHAHLPTGTGVVTPTDRGAVEVLRTPMVASEGPLPCGVGPTVLCEGALEKLHPDDPKGEEQKAGQKENMATFLCKF